jgi:UDP-N-acetylmuramate dehydrogenase
MARKNDRGKSRGRGGTRQQRAKRPARGHVAGAKKKTPAAAQQGRKAAEARPASPAAPPKIRFKGRLLENEGLARYTTWRMGGPARFLLQPGEPDDVAKALEFAKSRGVPWVILGLGSNVLIKDSGFPGLVIRMGKGMDTFEMKGATAIVGAGLPTPLLARRTAEAGFVGVERFIGIPGTVGGGVYMNSGCHGAEFSEIVTEVTVMDGNGRTRTLPRKQISYKYRSSNLGDVIVLEAKLSLGEEDPAKLKEIQSRLLRWRKAKTPFDQPTAGSTFRNPEGSKTAGMLIEEAGLKGFAMGGVQVSPMHANYFVNTGTGTATDAQRLIDHVQKTVRKKTGVELELEVKVFGE